MPNPKELRQMTKAALDAAARAGSASAVRRSMHPRAVAAASFWQQRKPAARAMANRSSSSGTTHTAAAMLASSKAERSATPASSLAYAASAAAVASAFFMTHSASAEQSAEATHAAGAAAQPTQQVLQNFGAHRPSDKVHVQLSVLAYKPNPKDTDDAKTIRETLDAIKKEGWEQIDASKPGGESDQEGFYAVAYANKTKNHIIISFRGTEGPDIKDWRNNFNAIFNHKMKQEGSAWAYAKSLIDKYYKEGYSFSFTGHSLGGWLAHACLYMYEETYPNYRHAFSVSLDDPGPQELLQSLESRLPRDQPIEMNRLDITGYLSYPNFVNMALTHMGTNYTLYPTFDLSKLGWTDKNTPKFTATVHDKVELLKAFGDTPVGTPSDALRILDWPRLVRGETSQSGTVDQTWLALSYNALSKLLSRNISLREYWGVWNYGYNKVEIKQPENLSALEGFELQKGTHFSVEAHDASKLPLRNMPAAVSEFLDVLHRLTPDNRIGLLRAFTASELPAHIEISIRNFQLPHQKKGRPHLLKMHDSENAVVFRDALQFWMASEPAFARETLRTFKENREAELITENDPVNTWLGLQKELADLGPQLDFLQGTARLFNMKKASKGDIDIVQKDIRDLEHYLRLMRALQERMTQLPEQLKEIMSWQSYLEACRLGSHALLAFMEEQYDKSAGLLDQGMQRVEEETEIGRLFYNRAYNLKAKIAAINEEFELSAKHYEKALTFLGDDPLTASNFAGRLTDSARRTGDASLDVKAYPYYKKAYDGRAKIKEADAAIVLSGIAYGYIRLIEAIQAHKIDRSKAGLPSLTTLKESVIRLLDEAIVKDSNYLNAYLYQAIFYYDQSDYEKALSCVNQALSLNLVYPSAVMRKGRILKALGRLEEACDYLTDAKAYFVELDKVGNQYWINEIDKILDEMNCDDSSESTTCSV